ncbi:MAG: class I SAM-dependent methyltransferase [Deltaproteobacteria bacterium]|nr:class I SAM-dependent methyltransferase [Deltaproteobacteria bacterium]
MKRRSGLRKCADFVTFPVRALSVIERDRFGLTSLADERYDYVSREVRGECLDVGCGRHNRFINEYRGGRGRGIDVYRHEGLTEGHVVSDISHFPFDDCSFETVTFIANLNHVPRSLRDVELREAHRVLVSGGKIVVTMGNPLAEVLTHKVTAMHDRFFGTRYELDLERGMHPEEEYYCTDAEIRERLTRAGFRDLKKKFFATQWCLNHLISGRKPAG